MIVVLIKIYIKLQKLKILNAYDYDKILPKSHTCFFTFDIFIIIFMKFKKMLYVMENSMLFLILKNFLCLEFLIFFLL